MTGTVKDLFAFALNLYRAPLQYRPFINKRNSVPPGFADFLDVLSKREGHEVWIEYGGIQGATSQELREAGVFLVKRILFVDDADHYRLFGLESTATIQEIRERYRLLIGLFHPDKRSFGDDWNELYAPKINDAYNILKNPEKRRNYDEDIGLCAPVMPQEAGSETLYWGDAGKEREVGQDSTRDSEIRSLSQANPFQGDFRENSGMANANKPSEHVQIEVSVHENGMRAWPVLLGLLIMLGAGLAAWYVLPSKDVIIPPGEVPAAQSAHKKTQPGAEKPPLASEKPNSQLAKRQAMKQVIPQAKPVTREIQITPQAVVSIPARKAPKKERSSRPVIVNSPPQADETVSSDQTTVDMAEAPARTSRPQIERERPTTEPMPQFPEDRIRQADIDYLLYRFVHSYQDGAIEDFVSLFDTDAVTDDGLGQGHIESLYGDLFDNSSARSMVIKDVLWAPGENRLANIAFLVEVWVERSPFLDTRIYGGDADMQVELGDTGLLITKFHHRVAPK